LQREREAEALLVVLELELRPVVADLRGHGGVELVDGDNDGVREVVRRHLPLLHILVLFLLQQLRGATVVGGGELHQARLRAPASSAGRIPATTWRGGEFAGVTALGRGLAAR
jgi:hypothetical protein